MYPIIRRVKSMNKNPNCDNDKCRNETGEVRVLKTGGDSNAILCRACYEYELSWRRERNTELAKDVQYDLPEWNSLKIYGAD